MVLTIQICKMKYLVFLIYFFIIYKEAQSSDILSLIKLPNSFSISIYTNVPNARQMALTPDGILFVGSRSAGKVYAIQDLDKDGFGETVTTIASKLRLPTGIAFKDGNLYVAAVSKIFKFPDIANNLFSPKIEIIKENLPMDSGHGWKYLKISKNNRLFFNIGAPCNVCIVKDPYGTISSIKLDGSDFKIHARGVRNSVGFVWHPITDDLWFTDNGRDGLGDNLPPCELNKLQKDEDHFGYPFCYGNNIRDLSIEYDGTCEKFLPPMLNLDAHVAPLGIDINSTKLFSSYFRNTIFIAEHGSWNRSKKIGYRISFAKLNSEHNKIVEKGIFAEGWLKNENASGRPADILFTKKGHMLVSDDLRGNIYIIKYPD